jgi:hypothetical protein
MPSAKRQAPQPWRTDPRAIRPAKLPCVVAVKAVAQGTASEDQQKRFMAWLIDEVCGYHDRMAYFGEDAALKTYLALGRRRVAEILKAYLDTPIQKFKEDGAPSEQVM